MLGNRSAERGVRFLSDRGGLVHLNSDLITCIYCKDAKHACEFHREHVLPEAFGKFKNALVLHDAVCKDCNQFFGNTLDVKLARGSLQGAVRYFRGIKPQVKFRNVDKKRVHLSARALGQAALRPAEFVETPEGEGLAFTPGISYKSVSSKEEQFVSLETLERGDWKNSDDIDRQHPVILSYYDDHVLERIQKALAQLKLGVEILDTVDQTEAGRRVLVVVDAVIEDLLLYRAVSKIAFNYLAYKMGRDFVLRPIFDQTRTFIRQGSSSNTLVKKIEPIKLSGDRDEAARRRGHVVALELAADGTTTVGFVEFFGIITYSVMLGMFGQLAIPISAGHYFDIVSKEVIPMDAIRPPPGLWIPR